MNITERQLEQSLLYINRLLKDCLANEACEEYIKLVQFVENKENKIHEELKAEFYVSFAYFLFNVSEYGECLSMFIKAQEYGYSKSEIRKIIWEAFIEPNLNEFKSIYERNMKFLISKGYILKNIDFNDLSFWLVPTMVENEYYIYDKNDEIIKEKIYIDVDNKKFSPLSISDRFADFLILEDWNWNNVNSYINSIKDNNKKSYVIINDFAKFLSFFQGVLIENEFISDVLIFDGFNDMKEYFKGCNAYLPRNIINLTSESEQVQKVIDEIHNYRITNEGRKGDDILLSICIPSYNRGNRAYDNVIHNLQCCYDEEIEIVLSNNGTQNETKEYYDKIQEINDSRISYFAFKENQGVAINICKLCEMAKGKFVLFLSDEDLIDFRNLDRIINILYNMKETLAVMRVKGDRQAKIPSTKLTKVGKDAMLTYMLSSNYLSGNIFNNELLKQYNATQYIKNNLDNAAYFYYPHVFLELFLCQYGDAMGRDIILISEGREEVTEVEKKEIGMDNKVILPKYASIEGRLEQHEGFFYIFRNLEICKKDFAIFRQMYVKLCEKTIFLVSVSINVFYKKTNSNLVEIFDQSYNFCKRYLDKMYSYRKSFDKKDYINDLEQIKRTYEYFKNEI